MVLLLVVALAVVLLLPEDLLVAETEDLVEVALDLLPEATLVVALLPVLPATLPVRLVAVREEVVFARVKPELLLLRLRVLLPPPVALCLDSVV